MTNEEIFKLAEQAGFVLWGDESWNPGDRIDWSSRYDDELLAFAKLLEEKIRDSL
jgi:hypothetical protein